MRKRATDELSLDQARKLILLHQGIHQGSSRQGHSRLLSTIEQLGYIQIDTISVVERAHHHTLWNRVADYQPQHLNQLVEKKVVFEYWQHAAAYLPMRDFRFSLPRKQAIASGGRHWFAKDSNLMAEVYRQIEAEGPMKARDFEHRSKKTSGWWDWKPAKKALEQLFIEGKLMIVRRQGMEKVYDLTNRVLPSSIDTSVPNSKEYCEFLITRFLQANGLAKQGHFGYLLKGVKTELKHCCNEMLADGRICLLSVGNEKYYALPDITDTLSQKMSRSKVVILSPFDNLVIQRKRIKEFFNFEYSLECYLPKKKRTYGYFCLPILWGRQFAGRMDVKLDRKKATLTLIHLHLETKKTEDFFHAFKPSFNTFLTFNQAQHLMVQQITSHRESLSQARLNQMKAMLAHYL